MKTESHKCVHCQAVMDREDDSRSGVCSKCWTRVVIPAYQHVDSVKPDDNSRMMWHGYALRDAFISGAMHMQRLVQHETRPD